MKLELSSIKYVSGIRESIAIVPLPDSKNPWYPDIIILVPETVKRFVKSKMIIDMVKRHLVISLSNNHHIYGIDMLLMNKICIRFNEKLSRDLRGLEN